MINAVAVAVRFSSSVTDPAAFHPSHRSGNDVKTLFVNSTKLPKYMTHTLAGERRQDQIEHEELRKYENFQCFVLYEHYLPLLIHS